LKEAMEKAGLEEKKTSSHSKRVKAIAADQEDLLSRTLSRRN